MAALIKKTGLSHKGSVKILGEVSVPLVALAGIGLPQNEALEGLLRQHTTSPFPASVCTGLLHLRRVDPVEPDLDFAYVDGVAINDTGFACDVGHCG